MNRALKELNAQTWFAGLRREQSGSRATLPVLAVQRGVFKVLPIIDWDNRTVYQYLQKHGLKYHPLWDQGYLGRRYPPPASGSRAWQKKRPGSSGLNASADCTRVKLLALPLSDNSKEHAGDTARSLCVLAFLPPSPALSPAAA